MLRAVVFDFDGVLVDSEPLHYRALRESLLPEGIAIDEAEYGREYLAHTDREAIRLALERHGLACDLSRVDGLARHKADLFAALLPEIPFFPGARELVRELAAGLPLAIASGALHQEIEAILHAGGIREAFSAIVGADDVAHGKPDPEPYRAAATMLRWSMPGLRPGDCLAIEDAMPGIVSARAAGLRVVAVTNTYAAPSLGAAHLVVASLEELSLFRLSALFED
jgi:beta-phosphoglucomutase-like phosphatase (HAD superfamily)